MPGYEPYPQRGGRDAHTGGRGGRRRGRGSDGRGQQNEQARKPVDRRAKCPLLARVLIEVGARSKTERDESRKTRRHGAFLTKLFDASMFADRTRIKDFDQVMMHTWKDATFRELLGAVLKAKANLKDPDIVWGYHVGVVKHPAVTPKKPSKPTVKYIGQVAPTDDWDNPLHAQDVTLTRLFDIRHQVGEFILLAVEKFEDCVPPPPVTTIDEAAEPGTAAAEPAAPAAAEPAAESEAKQSAEQTPSEPKGEQPMDEDKSGD
eukprot:TRINITY_DN28716_c0_g1_i1.p1 TRINITY_DN28716_c0_g1~~TRINITY_DN28716_c0_g1_i1.p1  ORF type:complete len:262 (+),score=67.72 TRINITY_DN28716_c0_g1_i1:758-1543(+)